MNIKTLLITGSLLLSSYAQANIIVKVPGNGDICANLSGSWVGGGKVTAGIIQCHYHGTVNATKGSGDNNFNFDIQLKKDDGICPDNQQLQLPGTCINGDLVLKTPNADLHGAMNSTGNAVDLAGNVTFEVFGSRVKADVTDMHLKKL